MNGLLNVFGSHDRDTQVLLLSWAEKHPYLFTIIEVTSPSLYVILAVAAFYVVSGMIKGQRRR